LQGKYLYLTFNNGALAQKLQQDIGTSQKLPQLADKDYHQPATWQNALTALAGAGGDPALDALIPPVYRGQTTADRLAAPAGGRPQGTGRAGSGPASRPPPLPEGGTPRTLPRTPTPPAR